MRKALLYGGVAVLLTLGLVLGIVWTKQRAQTYASKPAQTYQEQPEKQSSAQQQPSSQKESDKATPDVAVQPTPVSRPSTVPATGPTSIAVSIFGFMAIALSAGWYMQTRHRLLTIR